MDVVGYTDRIGVAPGEPVRLMISATVPEVRVSLVRLVHGDEPVASSLDGTYPATHQPLRTGSHIVVDHDPRLAAGPEFGIALWMWPTLLAAGEQPLIGKEDTDGAGWSLGLTADSRVRFTVGGDAVITGRAVRERSWYLVEATVSAGRLTMVVSPQQNWVVPSLSVISEPEPVSAATTVAEPVAAPSPLLIAASPRQDGTFNGKLAAVRLHNRTELVAAWDFSRDVGTRRVVDVSGNGLHGRTVQLPTRAVTGPRWADPVTSYHDAPDLYDAIHFHDDDLDDAGWTPTVEWTVDPDLRSGVYAAHVRSDHGDDHVPIIVRPPRNRATARILFVAPMFSYLAYGNLRALDEHLGIDSYVRVNRLNSLYDSHSDGSGVCYSSWWRPLPSMRPSHHLPLLDSPHQFSADLHLVDWLHHHGHRFDVVTDEDVHREGAALLRRYDVVLSGSHAEYWSGAMLDALDGYLNDGGRYLYLSGNGMYWVTGFDEDTGHTVEVRRYGAAVSAWHTQPAEWHLSTTGERGGLWRWRGRAPQRYVGVGFAGCWADTPLATGSAYRRQPGSHDPRAAFVFEGVTDELIGDFPNLVLSYGAAGYEVDRADPALGTPPHALILASATDFPAEHWRTAPEEIGRGELRADMVFFETPGGGAVFTTGSIAWCGALSHNDYDNNVSTITANVLRRFLSRAPFG